MSGLIELVSRYTADREALLRRYDLPYSGERRARLREFYREWQAALREVDWESLGQEGRVDALLLRDRLKYELHLLEREEALLGEMAPLVPYTDAILGLHEARRRLEEVDPPAAAESLAALAATVEAARGDVEQGRAAASPVVGGRAAAFVERLRATLEQWYRFHAGYDPLFTWWAAAPYETAEAALRAHQALLSERVALHAPGAEPPVTGDPIGAEGLRADLEVERIPYSVEELIAIGEREFAWCEARMREAARDMGCADWRKALEHVKRLHVEPGRQPALVRELALEAIRFVEERDLVTVPPLAKEVWRMEMMAPEAQRVNPFFLGGEVIRVSFPTDTMAHDEKQMSLRGNNVHFARATVQHELIPGHHLQGFMLERFNRHRRAFSTCFWIEGWALHWEMLLWDLGFPRGPEDRVGMLFWRMHRAARILFSLKFHLGQMTPDEAADFLVERVGHERANAAAEVRRSFGGDYPPLYQAAYMLGGLQFRALHREVVGAGRMTDREFHDAILQGGPMPVELLRARLLDQSLAPDTPPSWRFADPIGE